MKLNSKFFDSIRVSSRRQQGAKKDARATSCQWKGCDKPGSHKAPKGRGRDGEYFHFCIDHVRQYNHEYNYFDGMSDAEVDEFPERRADRPPANVEIRRQCLGARHARRRENRRGCRACCREYPKDDAPGEILPHRGARRSAGN